MTRNVSGRTLSGFLITGILLRGTPTVGFVSGFYLRRAMRLFPLYYLVLAFVLAFSEEVRTAWSYYAFYGVNLLVAAKQRWGVAPHFWSLAVEEQFYLVWPFVVLWVPRRAFVPLCVAFVITGVMFRFISLYEFHNSFDIYLLPGSIDALACGALLAWFGPKPLTLPRLALALISLAALLVCWRSNNEITMLTLTRSAALPALFLIVGGVAVGLPGIAGRMLAHPVLVYVGRISYGMYLIHFFVIGVLGAFLPRNFNPYIRPLIYVAITVGLAAFSWHFYERPINDYRGRAIALLAALFRRRAVRIVP